MWGFNTDPGEMNPGLNLGFGEGARVGGTLLGGPCRLNPSERLLPLPPDHSWAGPSGKNPDENTEDPPWAPGKNLCHALGDRLKVCVWGGEVVGALC